MKVAVRVDASTSIGTGHFVRCLTLADELARRGVHIRFVSRHLPEHLRSSLAAKGYEFALLDSGHRTKPDELAHASWLGVSQSQDAEDSIRALSDEHWDWLIVDHYALDVRWESKLRQVARKILVVDDIADRRHDCNILLDQNHYADMTKRYGSKVPENCRLLLGPPYALLRAEFERMHGQIQPRTGSVQRILVFFGGMDADNHTGRAIEALAALDMPGIHVDVVIGERHPHREQIKLACMTHGFVCHVQTDKMADLMAAADMAIGGGGVATWERCCLGLPALAIATAENQRQQIADAARDGLLYAPNMGADLVQAIRIHVRALCENGLLREHISRNGMRLVNGRGVSQLIANMGIDDVEIRKVVPTDSQNMFRWRNHPIIRAVSRSTDVIDWEKHQAWFASMLADPNKIVVIGERSGSPVGVVRFDRENDEAEISIYVVPEKIASGTGKSLLQSAENWLAANYPDIRKIRAYVLGINERSQRLFSGAGYETESTYYTKRLH